MKIQAQKNGLDNRSKTVVLGNLHAFWKRVYSGNESTPISTNATPSHPLGSLARLGAAT